MSSEEIERVRREAKAAEQALLTAMAEGGGGAAFGIPSAGSSAAKPAAKPVAVAAAAAASPSSSPAKSLSKSLGIVMVDDDDGDNDDDENGNDASDGSIPPEFVEESRTSFGSRAIYRIAQNAAVSGKLDSVALNHSVVQHSDFTFSVDLHPAIEATNQKRSGRCWIFAALNVVRFGTVKKLNVEQFEFSQNYLFFWDKFERANYFLQAILSTAKLPVTDREVAFLLDNPVQDGGQWNMISELVKKYGLVPKSAMPDTEAAGNSAPLNAILKYKLREAAKSIRTEVLQKADNDSLQEMIQETLQVIWRILNIHLGTPPVKFDWQWTDKDHKFHRVGSMTPQEFASKYAVNVDDYICLVHDPRKTSPVNKTFTVKHLGNVVGGSPVKYLNVDIQALKDLSRKTLEHGEPVWFGCDVGKQLHRELGLWDRHLFDYEGLYDTKFTLTKEDRLIYHESQMTHAMTLNGVDVVDNKTRRWKVENSWGTEQMGRKGYFAMADNWFEDNVFEIAVRKNLLSKEQLAAYEQDPIVLPAWDPMGALASAE